MSIEDIIHERIQRAIEPLATAIEALTAKIKTNDNQDEIPYPVSMVAVLTGKSRATIYNMIDRGDIKVCSKKGEADKVKFKSFKHLIKG